MNYSRSVFVFKNAILRMCSKKYHRAKENTHKILFFTFPFGLVGCNWVNEGKSGMQLIYEGFQRGSVL